MRNRVSPTLALIVFSAVPQVAPAQVRFDLPGTDGVRHSSVELSRTPATVLVFLATDCPISNRYSPLLHRLEQQFASRRVRFVAVFSEASLNIAQAARHLKEFQLSMPGLLDPSATLARETGVRVTPEVALLDENGNVAYRGRINDRYVDYGKERAVVQHEDLSEAIEQVLAHKPVREPVTKALGCAIAGAQS